MICVLILAVTASIIVIYPVFVNPNRETTITNTFTPTTIKTSTRGGHSLNNSPSYRVIELIVPKGRYVIIYKQVDVFDSGTFNYVRDRWDICYSNITKYIKLLETHGAHIVDLNVIRYDENTSIIIRFKVDNRVWSDDRVTADFLWFLNTWGLDFIDDKFNETNWGLEWTGVLNGIRTRIIVRVPEQLTPYKAWNTPYGHCHGHVWWPRG